MSEDSINVKLHKAKVKIEVVSANLAGIGLEGICTRLRAIVKELGDIEKTLGTIHENPELLEQEDAKD